MALRFNVLDAETQAVVDRIVKEHGEGQLAPTPLSTPFSAKRKAPERNPSGAWRGRSRWNQAPTTPPSTGRVLPRRNTATGRTEGRSALPRRRSSVSRPWADGPLTKTLPALSTEAGEADRTQRLDADRLRDQGPTPEVEIQAPEGTVEPP